MLTLNECNSDIFTAKNKAACTCSSEYARDKKRYCHSEYQRFSDLTVTRGQCRMALHYVYTLRCTQLILLLIAPSKLTFFGPPSLHLSLHMSSLNRPPPPFLLTPLFCAQWTYIHNGEGQRCDTTNPMFLRTYIYVQS